MVSETGVSPAGPMLGGCNCGAVRYRVTGTPLTAYICHCHLCQKRTGSAFSMSLVFPAGAVEITAGEPVRTERVRPDGGKNVSWVCAACLSRLVTERGGSPTMNLRAGTLDDTSNIRPVAQFWTSSAQPWAVVPGDILTYAEQPTDFMPMLAAWKARSSRADE
jgi:hypothetical protein